MKRSCSRRVVRYITIQPKRENAAEWRRAMIAVLRSSNSRGCRLDPTSSDHSSAKSGHAHFADQLKHLQSAAMRHRRATCEMSLTAECRASCRTRRPCGGKAAMGHIAAVGEGRRGASSESASETARGTQKNPLAAMIATSGCVAGWFDQAALDLATCVAMASISAGDRQS